MKKIIKEYWLLLTIASIIIIIDQITKAIVRANIPFGMSWMPIDWLAPYFRFVNWENHGAAFGMFQEGGIFFGIMAVVVSVFIILYFPKIPQNELLIRSALSMQMGGAIGNLIDRIQFGPVTDFISVGQFPVFNVADASITVGVGLLIFALWLSERKEKEKQNEQEQEIVMDDIGRNNSSTVDGQT